MTTSSLSPVIRTAEDYGQRDAADDLARRVTVARGATFGLHRLSLMQLAVRLAAAEMARLGVAPATALGAEAVAARVSFETLRDQALRYFAPVARAARNKVNAVLLRI